MSADAFAPVIGDPAQIAAAGATLSAVSSDVATQAARLRALAQGTASWSGSAADRARARAATLPPKLDKITTSYASAGDALRSYATALAQAQVESRTAVANGARASEDLAALRTAQAAAAAADARAAAVATAAGRPIPPPTAGRFQAPIDDAESRLAQAVASNADAHDAQATSARRAASALQSASAQGMHNRSWWQQVSHVVTRVVGSSWTGGLRLVSRLGADLSMLATVVAMACAVGGMFFPPLELAAGVAETVAMTSGIAAGAATTIADFSNPRTRRAGAVSLAMMAMPTAGRKLARVLPLGALDESLAAVDRADGGELAERAVATPTEVTSTREIPLGFADQEAFERFGSDLRAGLDAAGYPDTVGIMQGSSVTGVKYTTGAPFDEGRVSDYDVALAGPDLFAAAKAAGARLRSNGSRTGELDEAELERLGLAPLSSDLCTLTGRPVKFMIYREQTDAITRSPSVVTTP